MTKRETGTLRCDDGAAPLDTRMLEMGRAWAGLEEGLMMMVVCVCL
jgi:hypothetical protein